MKTMWAVVCVAVALAVSGPVRAVESFDTLLPEDTFLYVSVRDVPEFLRKIEQVPAYKIFREKELLKKLLPAEALEEVQKFLGTYIEPLGEILRGEVAFAITGIEGIDEDPKLVLLADIAGGEEALERYLEKAIFPLAAEDEGTMLEEIRLGGVKVTRIASADEPETQVLLGVKDGVLIVARQQDTFEALVGWLGAGQEKPLSANEGFADVRRSVGEADVVGYVNIEAFIRAEMEAAAEEEDEEYGTAFFEEFRARFEAITGFKGLRAAGFGMTFGAEGGTTTLRVFGDGPPSGGIFGALARTAPPLKSLEYVSDDAVLYMAVSLGSFSRIYEELVASLKAFEKASGEEPLADVEEALGVLGNMLEMNVVEEVLPAFGGEVAVAAWVPEGLDVPPAAVMIEVKDRATVERLVERILELAEELSEGEIAAETAQYEGVEITSVKGVPMMIPGVALVGDFLVVATNPRVIEGMVDTLAGGENLAGHADYKRYVSSLPGDATVTMYLAVKRVFEWGYPLLVAYVKEMEEVEEGDEASPLVSFVEALGSLGEALSGFGTKVVGDEGGATVTSRSANGGLGPVLFFGGFCVSGLETTEIVQRTPGTSEVEFGKPGGYAPETE